MRRSWSLVFIAVLGCGSGRIAASDTSADTTETSTTQVSETETAGSEESETGNGAEVCEFGCEGAVEVAEGIVECPDGRLNRIDLGRGRSDRRYLRVCDDLRVRLRVCVG